MRRFWKRVNRGLVLGGVLLLILIGFIVIKEVQFRTEASQIRDSAKAAVEAMLDLNVSETSTVIGQVRSDEVSARARARMETMLSQYWDADADSDYYINVTAIRDSYETYLDEPVLVRFDEITLELPDRAIDVRQNGTDYAVVTLELDNLAARYQGDGEAIFFGEYYGSEDGIGISLGEYVGSYYGYVEMELHRKDGQWRTCGMNMTLYMTNKTVAEAGGKE